MHALHISICKLLHQFPFGHILTRLACSWLY